MCLCPRTLKIKQTHMSVDGKCTGTSTTGAVMEEGAAGDR